jgi:hypothetical protein
VTWDGFKKRRVLEMKRREENETKSSFLVNFFRRKE